MTNIAIFAFFFVINQPNSYLVDVNKKVSIPTYQRLDENYYGLL